MAFFAGYGHGNILGFASYSGSLVEVFAFDVIGRPDVIIVGLRFVPFLCKLYYTVTLYM